MMALSNLKESAYSLSHESGKRGEADLVLPVRENLALDRRTVGLAVGAITQTLFLVVGEKQGFHPVLLIQSLLSVKVSLTFQHQVILNIRVRVSVNRGVVYITL